MCSKLVFPGSEQSGGLFFFVLGSAVLPKLLLEHEAVAEDTFVPLLGLGQRPWLHGQKVSLARHGADVLLSEEMREEGLGVCSEGSALSKGE